MRCRDIADGMELLFAWHLGSASHPTWRSHGPPSRRAAHVANLRDMLGSENTKARSKTETNGFPMRACKRKPGSQLLVKTGATKKKVTFGGGKA